MISTPGTPSPAAAGPSLRARVRAARAAAVVLGAMGVLFTLAGCSATPAPPPVTGPPSAPPSASAMSSTPPSAPAPGAWAPEDLEAVLEGGAAPWEVGAGFAPGTGERVTERATMVREQLAQRGIDDPRVLTAMARVPRHRFIPWGRRGAAYDDGAQPIGYGQTISQPYVVALMTELLDLQPGDRVLEIGTGSGYHAAVLAQMAAEVYSIEILKPLADRARRNLTALGVGNVRVRMGDGYRGWPTAAPFDAILLTAAPAEIPRPLIDQLAPGGRLVAPVGEGSQELTLLERTESGVERRRVATVFFVPMVGEAEQAAGEAGSLPRATDPITPPPGRMPTP